MSEVTIRPLVKSDMEAWEPLWQGYLSFYKSSLPPYVSRLTFSRLTGGTEPSQRHLLPAGSVRSTGDSRRWKRRQADRGSAGPR
jgi:hypothetical protein